MSDFDPYYKWLGIPPQEQPPNHYQLLGIQMLEQSTDVIEAAANRQMAYLQELSSGNDHIDEAQGLLGEVARARVCLLTAESKARYDAELVSTLDSLPEAEEEASAPQAEPIVNASRTPKPSSARRSSSTARRKTTSGSRGHSSGSKKSTSRKKINTGDSTKESSSLAIKIVAAVVPAVLVLIIGVILMSGGGGEKNKANNISNSETAGRSSQSDAGKGVPKSTEAEKKKTDLDLEKKLARLENQRPKPPEPKPDNSEAPETKSTPLESAGADAVDVEGSGLSETEQAEALLNAKGLEEGFNSQWELAELTKAYEETKNATGSQSNSGNEGDFQTELVRQTRQYFNALKEFYKQTNYQHPANNPSAREAAAYLNSVGQRGIPDRPDLVIITFENGSTASYPIPEDIPPISLTDKVQREVSTQPSSNPASNEAINEIAGLLRDEYQKLSEDAKVQAALKTVEGSLAEAPDTANVTQAETPPPAEEPSVPAKTSEQVVTTEDGAAGSDVENNANDENQSGGESEEPTVGFDQLKEKFTTLEKETKKTLGEFNKEAKNYISQKKNLVKRIKAGEALYAKRGRQQDAIQYPEQKTKFGEETDAKVTKPLQALKVQLQKLSKPDAAAMEGNLSRAEKLLEQIKTTPEYAANQKSIAGLAETIAKYHRGFNVQQAKMAK